MIDNIHRHAECTWVKYLKNQPFPCVFSSNVCLVTCSCIEVHGHRHMVGGYTLYMRGYSQCILPWSGTQRRENREKREWERDTLLCLLNATMLNVLSNVLSSIRVWLSYYTVHSWTIWNIIQLIARCYNYWACCCRIGRMFTNIQTTCMHNDLIVVWFEWFLVN